MPGFISTHVFEDEEDLPGSLSGDAGNESPIEGTTAVVKPATTIICPSDRRHLILEDVDGELEMEDASKDDRVLVRVSLKQQLEVPTINETSESELSAQGALPPLASGSPPLPLDSPPSPPP